MSSHTAVNFSCLDHVAYVELDRPEVSNSLNTESLHLLQTILKEIRTRSDIWVVCFSGAGNRAFCAGADLKERKSMSPEEVETFVLAIRSTMNDIAQLPQPTLAAINGHAFGGGCELSLSCDLRLMQSNALIGLTETSLAIIPGAGGCVRLPRLIGLAKAKEMILLSKRLSAEEALNCGLVHQIAGPKDFLKARENLLGQLLNNGPLALQAAKLAIDGSEDLPLMEALQHESDCYEKIIPTSDRLEALIAFSEKRKPKFTGH